MKVDLYTKIMRTVIAVALLGILFQPYISTQPAIASSSVIDVNIKEVAGRRITEIPVDIRKVNNQHLYRNQLPVEVK